MSSSTVVPFSQRASQRYDVRMELELSSPDGVTWTATTRDVSLGGLFVETTERPAIGARLHVRLRLPAQRDPLEVVAIVRWLDPTGFGLQFDGLRARDVWALGKLLERHAPR